MLPFNKFNYIIFLIALLLVHQAQSEQDHKNEKIVVESADEDLLRAESADQPTELDVAGTHKQSIASPTGFLLNKSSGGNNAPLGLNFFKHLPPQPFSSASSSSGSSIFTNPFGQGNPFAAHSPTLAAKAAALIAKPRALGANFVQRTFPSLLNNAAAVSSHQMPAPVYNPSVASSNIVLQQAHNPHFNAPPPPPPPQQNHFLNNGRPSNQINNAPINLPPLSPAENTIDLQELGAPFFENNNNHVRHNSPDREHNLPMPPNNSGPPMNEHNDRPMDNQYNNNNNNGDWPMNGHKQMANDKPRIVHLDVKCEKNLMKVFIEFDRPFNGLIFSKGHYSYPNCVHLQPNTGRQNANFDIMINQCGTQGNTQNGFYGYGAASGSGTFFENTVVIQYDPQVQEAWDTARKLRCTWHDQYEKAVSFRPFPVDMLDVVKADFAGDNVGCWMQIQVGKGPWASEVAGIVKIGQTMTMVLAIKDEENKFDMLVRNCIAHDGERAPIELVDGNGCIVRPKLMSRFTKIKNFGNSATVLSYAHFQAFKFPDSMEVHFQCTIQICRFKCPEQCSKNSGNANDQHFVVNGKFENQRGRDPMANGPNGDLASAASENAASESLPEPGQQIAKPRSERDVSKQLMEEAGGLNSYVIESKEVGLSRVLNVVSQGDLAFSFSQFNHSNHNDFGDFSLFPNANDEVVEGSDEQPYGLSSTSQRRMICVSGVYFFGVLMTIGVALLITCCGCAIFFIKHRSALRAFRSKGNGGKFACSSASLPSDLYSNVSVPPPYSYATQRK